MQQHCTELTQKLLNSIDKEYNVVDMGAVVDVITALEKTTITKEVLESTRLGKHINELRRQTTNDALAKRAKDLVRRWREMVLPPTNSSSQVAGGVATVQGINGTKPQSPGVRVIPRSRSPPGNKIFKPQSPLLRDGAPLKVLSPALSLTSDQSRSPNPTPTKHLPASLPQNHRLNQPISPKLSTTSHNPSLDAVPRTHSSNKRLRKDEPTDTITPLSSKDDHNVKKQRINGENVNINVNTNSQVPSPLPINSSVDVIINTDDNSVDIGGGPKKRGRKKGSKSVKNQQQQQDRVKEKLASISRNPKLKTTQELLADLQARGSTVTGAGTCRTVNEPPTTEEILRCDADEVPYPRNNRVKLTNSGKKNGDDGESVDDDNFDKITYHDPTVEEILAKLPPLDHDSIRWSDDEEPASPVKRDINDDDVDRLHDHCVEGLNGNYQFGVRHSEGKDADDACDIKRISGIYRRRSTDTDREFREWHEMLARPSYDGQILHILPYVIID
ncbi:mediator of RNA polymerase II transcription subunit 26 [Diachasma alloeum]|uniref:mediator of RNA polymerase II transcription subunit 26 n=1 Tax=Diachasma alloeum TaxID=454923 RepID=UPI000738173E|nr:mediator of RNA polymerase II transcription subunit 26 [Diachasma alloeum]